MLTFEQLLRQEAYQEGFQQGFQQGVQQGFQQGQRELLLSQLTEAFGSLPAAITERVSNAGRQDLERWSYRLLDAASLDDVFAAS